MQITLMPDLHGNETVNRIIDSKHVSSVEHTGKQVEITMDNGTIFIENYPSQEEAERRYDDFCILWAAGDTVKSIEPVEPTRTRTRTRTHARKSLKWIKLEATSNTYFFKAEDIRYIRTFPSGIRVNFIDGRSTDIMMDPDKAEDVIMGLADED